MDERAIDVPLGFIAAKKEKPKWPATNARSPANTNGLSSNNSSTASRPTRTATPNSTLDGTPNRNSIDDQIDGRVRFHEDELRKRRDEEERAAREREFLQGSLRGSAKLKALEHARTPQQPQPKTDAVGVVNVAFDGDAEHDNATNLVRERSSSRRRKTAAKTVDEPLTNAFDSVAIDRLLQEIQTQLWTPVSSTSAAQQSIDPALKDDLVAVQQLLRADSTRRLLATCDLLARAKRRVDAAQPSCANAAAIADELGDQLDAVAKNKLIAQRSRQVRRNSPNCYVRQYLLRCCSRTINWPMRN